MDPKVDAILKNELPGRLLRLQADPHLKPVADQIHTAFITKRGLDCNSVWLEERRCYVQSVSQPDVSPADCQDHGSIHRRHGGQKTKSPGPDRHLANQNECLLILRRYKD